MKFFKQMLFTLTLGLITISGAFATNNNNVHADSNMNPAYDLSEWQHNISNKQAKRLKNESSFIILRAQYGGNYSDKAFAHNASMMQKYGIPYGVYSYSLYNNKAQAREEAEKLYDRAPDANFYVNDLEQSNSSKSRLNKYTKTWSNTIKSLTDRPTVLYSGQYYMNGNITNGTRNHYDAIWLANYSKSVPNTSYHYDLWQFTSSYRSKALGKSVDASIIPDGGKSLSFWTENNSENTDENTNNDDNNSTDADQNNAENGSGVVFPDAPSSNTDTNNVNNGNTDVNNNQDANNQNNTNNNNNQNSNNNSQLSFPITPTEQ